MSNALVASTTSLSVAALVAAALLPPHRPAIGLAWALGVLGIAATNMLAALGRVRAADERRAEASAPGTARPRDLVRLERVLSNRTYDPREFDHRIRPLLRDLASARAGRAAARDVRVASLMGPEPSPTPVTRAQIAELVTAIEEMP